jgi:hypothetical protein
VHLRNDARAFVRRAVARALRDDVRTGGKSAGNAISTAQAYRNGNCDVNGESTIPGGIQARDDERTHEALMSAGALLILIAALAMMDNPREGSIHANRRLEPGHEPT